MDMMPSQQSLQADTEPLCLTDLKRFESITQGLARPAFSVSAMMTAAFGVDLAVNYALVNPYIGLDARGHDLNNSLLVLVAAGMTSLAYLLLGWSIIAKQNPWVTRAIAVLIAFAVGGLSFNLTGDWIKQFVTSFGLDGRSYYGGILGAAWSLLRLVLTFVLQSAFVLAFCGLFMAPGIVGCICEIKLAGILERLRLRRRALGDIARFHRERKPAQSHTALLRFINSPKPAIENAAKQAVAAAAVHLAKQSVAYRTGQTSAT